MNVRTGLCVLSITMAVATAGAAPTELAYAPRQGSQWTSRFTITAKIPMSDTSTDTVLYRQTCRRRDGDLTQMTLHIAGEPEIDGTFTVDGDGSITNLVSGQLSDPAAKPYLLNLGLLLFPAMPGGAVDVGESWTARSALYLPPRENMPERLRIDSTFTFKGMASGNRARVAVALRSASGEAAKVDVKGELLFDVAAGRVHSFTVQGELKVRKVVWWTVPVTISVTTN